MGNRSLAFFLMSGLLDSNQRPRAPQKLRNCAKSLLIINNIGVVTLFK